MPEYSVNIDFDEASNIWRSNKKHIGNGSFKYICGAITKKNKQCSNKPMKNSLYCYCHNKVNQR